MSATRRIPRGRCHYCARETFETQHFNGAVWKRPATNILGHWLRDEATKDHKHPKSRGGNAGDNILLACFLCNQEKGNRDYGAFLETFHPDWAGTPLAMGKRPDPRPALAVGWAYCPRIVLAGDSMRDGVPSMWARLAAWWARLEASSSVTRDTAW